MNAKGKVVLHKRFGAGIIQTITKYPPIKSKLTIRFFMLEPVCYKGGIVLSSHVLHPYRLRFCTRLRNKN